MRVHIGSYNHWFQPYSWAKKFLRWWNGVDTAARLNLQQYEDGDRFARKNLQWLRKIEDWFDARYDRKIEVRIDYWDTWNMDNTLAVIVLPMLKQLKEKKHGSALVDDDDVPDELKSINAEPLTDEQKASGYTDNNVHKRWEWVLNEMIWAFEQIVDPDADSQFFSNADPAKPCDATDIPLEESVRRVKLDKDGYTAWQNRKTRGLTLFGKYYEGLWD